MSNAKSDPKNPAPDATAAARAQLGAEMRRIKEGAQLSFGGLADRTHYSRSSWERFLNGKQLPTPVAVEQLAAVAGTPPEPLLDLLARAGAPVTAPVPVVAGRTTGAHTAAGDTAAGDRAPGERPGVSWRRRCAVIGYIAAGALMGSVATGLLSPYLAGAAQGPDPAKTRTESKKAGGQGADLVPRAGDIEVKCTSDACWRNDPQAMECQWDAKTAKSTYLRGMQIELRYSAACQAVWGRIEGGAVGDKVIIKDARGMELDAFIRFEHDSYTKMLGVSEDAPLDAMSVCGEIPSEKQMQCAPTGTARMP
ncbi:helix-turn-helix domain-containing protein [Streptomyces drozdowiczii]|uniref:XRE family transcriptional regulator n=1 Tax=Streptomyces drozdowiczii TaxID=202862 RepID=A0ABY6PM07_9ACTN|nr:XRE family transcriptional regulator [Streptomyces drozdowiczii]MCX0247369.1 XRE family transcriptional regulator [Streptomyces drozdowiczii]UZK53227.1 XRE family transcriptional regulator [Streptomyces drozdowiczii]